MVGIKTREYAQLSLVVYGDEGKQSPPWKELEGEGYKPNNNLECEDEFKNKYEFWLPADFYGQVFYNPGKKEIVFALRGTEIPNPFDLLSDVTLAVNKDLSQLEKIPPLVSPLATLLKRLKPRMTVAHFKKAVKFFDFIAIENQNYKDRYNEGYKLAITGHSLGGACAQYLALKLYHSGYGPVHTETFNAPGILESLKEEDAYGYNELDIINHVRYSDVIGKFGTHLGECRYYAVDNYENAHSMRKFYLDLENDPQYYKNPEGAKAYLESLTQMSKEAQNQFILSGGNIFPNF